MRVWIASAASISRHSLSCALPLALSMRWNIACMSRWSRRSISRAFAPVLARVLMVPPVGRYDHIGTAPEVFKARHPKNLYAPCSMTKETTQKPRRAIVAAVQRPSVSDLELEASLTELRQLAKTLGLDVVHTFTQKRAGFDSAGYFGVGKRKELQALVEEGAGG